MSAPYSIATVMTALATIEAALTISSPIAPPALGASVLKAWPTMPPKSVQAPDVPCFMNGYSLTSYRRANSLLKRTWEIHVQFFGYETDDDRAALMAANFHEALTLALDGKITLSGSCTTHSVRGASPTIAILSRAGRDYVGFELFLDVVMDEARTFAAA